MTGESSGIFVSLFHDAPNFLPSVNNDLFHFIGLPLRNSAGSGGFNLSHDLLIFESSKFYNSGYDKRFDEISADGLMVNRSLGSSEIFRYKIPVD